MQGSLQVYFLRLLFVRSACLLAAVGTPPPPPTTVTLASLPILVRLGGSSRGVLTRSVSGIPSPPTKLTSSYSAYFTAPKVLQARTFSYTRLVMVAQKINGTAIALSIRERLNHEIADKQAKSERFKPALTIIQGQLYIFYYCSLLPPSPPPPRLAY